MILFKNELKRVHGFISTNLHIARNDESEQHRLSERKSSKAQRRMTSDRLSHWCCKISKRNQRSEHSADTDRIHT